MRSCLQCGTEFKPGVQHQVNCSRRCTVRRADARRRARGPRARGGCATPRCRKDLACPCGTRDPARYRAGLAKRCIACDKRAARNGECVCGRALYKTRPCECRRLSGLVPVVPPGMIERGDDGLPSKLYL